MNLLHITDIHFGPFHWAQDDALVLERLNSFDADIVLNTGDMTSDSLESEYRDMADFLARLKCQNIVSIIGNHDKYSKRSHELFREHIYDTGFIAPKDPQKLNKEKVFFSPKNVLLQDYFTEINYLRLLEIKGETVLFVCVDTCLFQNDMGEVELQILETLKDEIAKLRYDRILMLAHHPVMASDEDPLINTKRLSDFILAQGIEAVFCGHTHELDILEISDVARGGKFRQFMCGSLSSVNISRDTNMFCYYENFGTKQEILKVIRMVPTSNGIDFVETVLGR